MNFRTIPAWARSCAHRLGMAAVAATIAIAGWSGNAVAAQCMAIAAGDPTLNCTANDFAVSSINITNILDNCTGVGDTFTFDGRFGVSSGSTARYDVGFYVGLDGVQAYTGTCFVTTIPTTAGFANLDGDQCGDYDGSAFLLPVSGVTSTCVDMDHNGFYDIAICESWDNNTTPNCTGPADAVPSTKAKCQCQRLNTSLATPRCASNSDCPTDNNPCTNEVCNTRASGLGDDFGCSHNNNTAPCSDGLFCTLTDTCSGGTCSAHSGNPCAGADGDGNCAESCNETTDTCGANDANGSPCNDGQYCTVGDQCTNGICAGTARNCADTNVCTDDACSEATDTCTHANNTAPCTDGLYCTTGDTCSGGTCSGPARDCGDGNVCTTDSCNEAGDACVNANNTAPCSDGLFCTLTDTCSGGTCSIHTGSPCTGPDGDGNCAESCNETTDTCSANDANGSACDDGLYCTTGDQCTGGVCAGTARNCADANVCTDDACNETTDACTHANNTAPCTDGLYCTTGDTCSGGTCSGPARDCGDGNVCTTDSCNEAGDACVNTNNTAPCSDGLFCTLTDTCSGGTCSSHVGNPCSGADGDGNCAESCNETTDTCSANDANGSACDDGLYCTTGDQCNNGVCTGTARNCADANVCTDDACSEATDTCTHASNTAPCNDGLYCTTGDVCSGGTCSGPARDCGDGNVCTTDSCNEAGDACVNTNNTAPCSDGLFCTLTDTCSGGTCSIHTGSPCAGADGDGNCAESCNESTDTCNSNDTNGTTCNDGQYCTVVDVCTNGVCSGAARNCSDGNVCTDDTCNEAGDTCDHPANTAPCTDGLYCTIGDVCSGGTCSGTARDCGDGNVCTTDSCNEAGDTCAHANNTEPCEDGDFCTLTDTCSGGTCSNHTGNPCADPDGDANCSESCNEAANNCTASDPDGSACDDGQYCTVGEQCASGVCSGAARDCSDGDVCTDDTCDDVADACTNPFNTAACDDGLFCTDGDVCGNGTCAGPPRDCGDGDVCTTDTCDEGGGVCVHTNNTEPCDDGQFCTAEDTCAEGICAGLAETDCADSTICTDDSCNEGTDSCVHTPNTDPCDDAIFCNGVDICAAGSCGHAGNPCPGPDGDGDCSETCDETANNCDGADLDGSICNDDVFCNGGPDKCLAGACSNHPGFPCDDEEFCTNDSCDEDGDTCSSVPVTPGTPCDDEDECTIDDGCLNGSCSGQNNVLMDLCPWIIVERQGPKRDTVKIGSRADVGGDVCGGLVRVGNITIIDGDLVSGSTSGSRQVRLSPDAYVDEDTVSAGAGARARPGVTKLPQLANPISALAAGSLTKKIDNTHYYDLTGNHPLADDCIAARESIPEIMGILDGLDSTTNLGRIKMKAFQSLQIVADDPGQLNVVDIEQLKAGKNVLVELDGGGNPDTVMVVRVAKKFMIRLQSTIVLSNGLLPENTLFYVKGNKCTFGDLMDGAGTVLCATGRLKTGRTVSWLGTFYGAGKILKIGDTNMLTYLPFQGF